MKFGLIYILLVFTPFAYCNTEPVIGIMTKPMEYKKYSKYNEVVESAYVQFVEGGGSRVVPISYTWDEPTLRNALKKINGILFMGGGVSLLQDGKLTEYAEGLKRALKIAKEFNTAGSPFTVWGTCLGFEAILILESEDNYLIKFCDCQNYTINLEYDKATKNSNRLFKKGFSHYLLDIMEKQNISFNNHRWMIDDEKFNNNKNLKNNYKILARSPWKSSKSKSFIAAIEHKDYPIYGVQFHPEKYNYEYNNNPIIVRDRDSIAITHGFSNFLSDEARRSKHSFETSDKLLKVLVQRTSVPVFDSKYGYLYCYIKVPRF